MAAGIDEDQVRQLVDAIRSGDVEQLRVLVNGRPDLANYRIPARKGQPRTPLHVATDWPGYFPNGPAVVHALVDAGADPNASRTGGNDAETPLHWAASTDDVDVAVALIDRGADLESPGASIAGGPPLDNAVGYGCWQVARLLVARGARVERLWQAAALGLTGRVEELLAADPEPTADDITHAFFQACHGGQRRMAEFLLDRGADIDAKPDYSDQTAVQVAAGIDTQRDILVQWLRDRGAQPAADATPA